MSILNQLASSTGRKDEAPNIELAIKITESGDVKAVQELVENLFNKNKDIQNDCIKVLYEIGERKPEMITSYSNKFITLLTSKNNRLQWGSMTALSSIAAEIPDTLYKALPKIIDASDKGTVITKDHCMKILISLCKVKKYSEDVLAIYIEQLLCSPVNQLPTYAENALPVVSEKSKALFIKTLSSRLGDIEKETKRKRVEKVISRLSKK